MSSSVPPAESTSICSGWAETSWNDGKSNKSPREYAEWFVPTTKTWSHSTFKSALKCDKCEEEKEAIMTQFWENYMSLAEKEPEKHGMDYVHAYIVFEKIL